MVHTGRYTQGGMYTYLGTREAYIPGWVASLYTRMGSLPIYQGGYIPLSHGPQVGISLSLMVLRWVIMPVLCPKQGELGGDYARFYARNREK